MMRFSWKMPDDAWIERVTSSGDGVTITFRTPNDTVDIVGTGPQMRTLLKGLKSVLDLMGDLMGDDA